MVLEQTENIGAAPAIVEKDHNSENFQKASLFRTIIIIYLPVIMVVLPGWCKITNKYYSLLCQVRRSLSLRTLYMLFVASLLQPCPFLLAFLYALLRP